MFRRSRYFAVVLTKHKFSVQYERASRSYSPLKNIIHKLPLMTPEVTFNYFEGQNYIAYDASLYTISMHAKN